MPLFVDNTDYTGLNLYKRGNSSGIILVVDSLANIPQYLSKLAQNPNNVTDRATLKDYPDRDTHARDQALSLGFNDTSTYFGKFISKISASAESLER